MQLRKTEKVCSGRKAISNADSMAARPGWPSERRLSSVSQSVHGAGSDPVTGRVAWW